MMLSSKSAEFVAPPSVARMRRDQMSANRRRTGRRRRTRNGTRPDSENHVTVHDPSSEHPNSTIWMISPRSTRIISSLATSIQNPATAHRPSPRSTSDSRNTTGIGSSDNATRYAAPIRSLDKTGLHREAHLVENEFVKGEWTDEVLLAFEKEDKPSRRRSRVADDDRSAGEPPSVVSCLSFVTSRTISVLRT